MTSGIIETQQVVGEKAPLPDDHNPDVDEDAIWARWHEHHDNSARELLIFRYSKLVRGAAISVYRSANFGYIELRDLIQLGMVGLLEAIDRFDPNFKIRFSTFSAKRIRGAILNGLEDQSEYHAQYAFRRRFRKDRLSSLKSGDSVKSDAFAEMVELTVGLAVGHMLEQTTMFVESEESPSSDSDMHGVMGLSRLLRRLVDQLPATEQKVITYHYLEGISFSDVAKLLGLSKGRISQIHAKAIARIRDAYRNLREFDWTA